MTLQEIVTAVEQLDVKERKQLLKIVRASLPKTAMKAAIRDRNVMEFEGISRAWQGIDVEQYINEMRDEWDKPRE